MRELVILSGKGGSGKTSITAAFAHLAHAGQGAGPLVLADADVDAANLELVLGAEPLEEHPFIGGAAAVIDPADCTACGACESVCRFEAVVAGETYRIDPIACEGCAACVYACPVDAIKMEPQLAGHWFRSRSRYGPLVHAALLPAQENSGKLVTQVKQEARRLAESDGYAALLVDGPPGIGCPVIAAASGATLALIVAEPTAAGIHDMARAAELAAHFRIPALLCINKADIYAAGAAQIEAFALDNGIRIAGRIPFDSRITDAMVQGEPVTAYAPEAPASAALRELWASVARRLME